jgi:hypothetical protein
MLLGEEAPTVHEAISLQSGVVSPVFHQAKGGGAQS